MAVADILSIDGDIEYVQDTVSTAMITLTAVATQLALASLETSTTVLDAALSGEPVIGSYANLTMSRRHAELARKCLESAESLKGLMCASKENLDDEVNEAYSTYLDSIIDIDPVMAVVSESERRLTLAVQSIPPQLTHASRFDQSVYQKMSA